MKYANKALRNAEDRIYLIQNRVYWQAFLKTVMNLPVPKEAGTFLMR
jgi:hypothetical protein